jgi:hypothetical protein
MIVKYRKDDAWGYIDNVRQAANKDIEIDELVKQYDQEVKNGEREDIASYTPHEPGCGCSPLPKEIAISNKVFLMVTESLADEGINRHSENLLSEVGIKDNLPACAILLYIEDCKEFDAMLLITNQQAYLMNDKGQTIERLV